MSKPRLEAVMRMWKEAGFPNIEIKDAPADAVTFDKMLVVFTPNLVIRAVYLYASAEDKFVAQF